MKKRFLIIITALMLIFTLAACNGIKEEYDMSSISFEDKEVFYNGQAHSIFISGTLPEGVSVSYVGNEKIEVGTYEVEANFSGAKTHKDIPSMKANLVIKENKDVELPDLSQKNIVEIDSELTNLGFNNIEIVEVFNVLVFSGRFVGYQNFKIGQTVDVQEKIVVEVGTRALPDLTQIRVEDIKPLFLKAGVQEANIQPIPQTEGDPEFGLGYYGDLKAGDNYTTGPIRYLYNSIEVKLRDLTGQSMVQMIDYFNKMDLTPQFEEVVDNTKEMETFFNYVGHSIGDIIPRNSDIVVLYYTNDDLDTDKGLFISKYADLDDGSSGLELYNPTNEAIDLSNYYLSIFEDGSIYETSRVLLSGTIGSKKTFFIASAKSSTRLTDLADLVSNKFIADGNDTIQLRKTSNNTFIDTLYNVGNTAMTMDEEIFVRRADITVGDRGFKTPQWAGYIPSFTEIIGTHPYEILTFPTFEKLEPTFQEYGMTKVKYLSAADGDTVYFESLDPRDTSDYSGTGRLRFLMVNTPETQKPGQPGQPYAQVAKRFTENALKNASEIYIQSDRAAGIKENYGRHLGLVWYNSGTPTNPEWHLLNYELVYYGLGNHMGSKDQGGEYKKSSVFGNRYLYQWVEDAHLNAVNNKLGIYSGVHQD